MNCCILLERMYEYDESKRISVRSEKHDSAFIEKMPPYDLYLTTIDRYTYIFFVQVDAMYALNTLIVTNYIHILILMTFG